MSPGNQGVFQLMKEVTFQRILTFCNSEKWGRFGGDECAARCASGWLVGLVREISEIKKDYKYL